MEKEDLIITMFREKLQYVLKFSYPLENSCVGETLCKPHTRGKTQVVAHSLDNSPEKQIQTVQEIA